MSNFKVNGLLDIYEGAKAGQVYLDITPKGCWTSVVSVSIRRDIMKSVSGPLEDWEIRIGVSSGGRDGTVGDIEAMGYLIEAIQYARDFASTVPHMSLERAFRQRFKQEYGMGDGGEAA